MSAPQKNSAQLPAEFLEFVANSLGQSDFETLPLAGDASTRRYYRIISGDKSLVLMSWEPFESVQTYPFLNVLEHLKKHNVNVPAVTASSPKLGLVLLEDLGDLTLERKFWENQNQREALPFYKLAIEELLKIHYPATIDRDEGCAAFQVAFDTEKLLWEMNYGKKHLIEGLCGIELSETENKELTRIFTEVCELLSSQERFICHRDFHSRNVMLHMGKVRIIDFQDARLGPIQYDLVSLVHDSYVDLSDDMARDIIDYYLIGAKEHRKANINRDEFYKVFRYQMLQRCFKACGSFSSFYNDRSDTRYLKYLTPTLQKVSKLLMDFPKYSSFYDILKSHGILDKNYDALGDLA